MSDQKAGCSFIVWSYRPKPWLRSEVSEWDQYPAFVTFTQFVKVLVCLNDPAKRTVKLAKDFMHSARKESDHKSCFSAVARHRKMVRSTKAGTTTKESLKKLGGSVAMPIGM